MPESSDQIQTRLEAEAAEALTKHQREMHIQPPSEYIRAIREEHGLGEAYSPVRKMTTEAAIRLGLIAPPSAFEGFEGADLEVCHEAIEEAQRTGIPYPVQTSELPPAPDASPEVRAKWKLDAERLKRFALPFISPPSEAEEVEAPAKIVHEAPVHAHIVVAVEPQCEEEA